MSNEPDHLPSREAAEPDLSVILITPDTFDTIRRTTGCIARQGVSRRIELVIIAPVGARVDVEPDLAASLAGVQIVRLPTLRPTGPARAAGIRAARAPIAVFAEEHCFPEPGWAEALLAAHRGDYAAVGPAMQNANPDTVVSWADFLIGYGPWAAPIEKGDVEYLPGHNSSYKAAVLLEYGEALDQLMEAETVLMWDLRAKGHRLLIEPAARASHMNFGIWSTWIRIMFLNGRGFADTRSARWSLARRLAFAVASPLIPVVRLARTVRHVRRVGRRAPSMGRLLPTIGTGLVFDAIGQMMGYTLGAGTAHERLAALEWHRLQHTREGRATTP